MKKPLTLAETIDETVETYARVANVSTAEATESIVRYLTRKESSDE